MALDMRDSIKILDEIKSVLGKKTTLEVNGNNGAGINFEQVQLETIEISEDEMLGDQLLGHPLMKELQEIKNPKRVFTINVNTPKEEIDGNIKRIIKRIKGK
jgi:hypothetical protein